MASRPHDGSEPDESRGEPDDPGRPGASGEPDPGALDGTEIEERWAEIVTRLGPGGVPDDAFVPDDVVAPGDVVVPDDDAGERGDPLEADPRGWAAPELEERFEPPDPEPVFGGDPLLTMAWIAVVGPILLLVASVVVWRDIPSIALRIAGVVFLVGLGVLFWRMPASRDDDAGPGAVV